MEKIQELLLSDKVNSFPSIQLPEPKISSTLLINKSNSKHKIKFNLPNDIPSPSKDSKLPGLIKGYKPPRLDNKNVKIDNKNILTGFNSANLMLDSNKFENALTLNNPTKQTLLSSINLNKSLDNFSVNSHKSIKKTDKVMNELRNYLQLMDQYSSQSFIIYEGRTLRNSPEFRDLRKAYSHAWGSMSHIITQLEKFMSEYDIKMSVIEGPKVYSLSQLNLSYYDKNDLLTCVANAEQIKPQLSLALTDAGIKQLNQSVVKIQSMIRRFLAKKRVLVLRSRWFSIIKIQSHFRRRQLRKFMLKLSKLSHAIVDDKWKVNRDKLHKWWQFTNEYADTKDDTFIVREIDKQITNMKALQSLSNQTNNQTTNISNSNQPHNLSVIPSVNETSIHTPIDSPKSKLTNISNDIRMLTKQTSKANFSDNNISNSSIDSPIGSKSSHTNNDIHLLSNQPSKVNFNDNHINNISSSNIPNLNIPSPSNTIPGSSPSRSNLLTNISTQKSTLFLTNTITSSDIEFMKPMTPDRRRLIIHIPSLHTSEYNRLGMDYLQLYENTHISVLYQLHDPDVHMIYVSPVPLRVNEIQYHEKFCELLGIPTIPKRLHFIVPELLNRLPQHLSLAQKLLCSTGALNRIKFFINRIPNAMIVTTSISWAEKKIVDYLNLPMISPEPLMSTTIHSSSFIKRQFIENKMNIPLGAFDIFTKEDLYIALSRLISTNLDIRRWKIKLNYDFNNDSIIYLDTDKLSLIITLRKEQIKLLDSNKNNLLSWFSRPVQFNIRQRIIMTLTNDLSKRITICNKKLYPSLDNYIKFIEMYGCVIEADPIEKLGNVHGLCFIDPTGHITYYGGVDIIQDDKYQIQGYIYPQTKVPILALQQATLNICKTLHKKFQVIGYVTVKYVACFDGLDNIPRILSEGIHFGMTPVFTSLSNVSVLTMKDVQINKSLLPTEFPTKRNVVIIPMAIHEPLKGTRDDLFFKLSHMKGISYDRIRKTGTIFFLIDSILSGGISFMTICSDRKKAINLAIYVCNFVIQQYGKQSGEIDLSWEQITSVISSLKNIIKQDEKIL